MAEPFLGEIRAFAFGAAPEGWHKCDGSLLRIMQNQALFALLGTKFGGDGIQTFGLPDLRGRVPLHPTSSIPAGTKGGEEVHALKIEEIPAHSHIAWGTDAGANSKNAAGSQWAKTTVNAYAPGPNGQMSPQALGITGSGHAHENRQPFAVTNYCIALAGIFPPRE